MLIESVVRIAIAIYVLADSSLVENRSIALDNINHELFQQSYRPVKHLHALIDKITERKCAHKTIFNELKNFKLAR